MKHRKPKKGHPGRNIPGASKIYSSLSLQQPLADKLQSARTLHHQGKLNEAEVLYREILKLHPLNFEGLQSLAILAFLKKNFAEAVELFDKAIKINALIPSLLNNRGIALKELKQYDKAVLSYQDALALKPDYVEALYNCGNAYLELKRFDDAISSYDKALALKPGLAQAYSNRGVALKELKRYDDALQNYDQSIVLKPDYAEPYHNRGNAFLELKRFSEALLNYNQALALKPDYAEAYVNRGNTLLKMKRYDEALSSCHQALAVKPHYTEAYVSLANTYLELKQYDQALLSYDKAINLNPAYAEVYSNRGNTFLIMKRYDDARQSYQESIAIKPDYAEAYANLGNVLKELQRYDDALDSYDKAIMLDPDAYFWFEARLTLKMRICDWSSFSNDCLHLIDKIERHEKAANPFCFFSLVDSLSLHQKVALKYVLEGYPSHDALPPMAKYPRHDKIRIGYFSADFRNHPVAQLTAELFELHDKSRFEFTAFSFGPNTKDHIRKRVEAAFDTFIDVQDLTELDIAKLSRSMEIDIAVDLGGFSSDQHTGIFALRAAPIQVSYLGFSGTMGAEYIDYIIADSTLVPEQSRQYYTEKIVYLPGCYMVNDTQRRIAEKVFTREELGLPKTGFVFCCFNNNNKITPATFDGWMRILMQVDGSVIWFSHYNSQAVGNLQKEAVRRGVNAERLIFGNYAPDHAEHLAKYRSADLFLDTLPYNAHTTASDALWAGLPVLTCVGESFAARVAASLLNTLKLPELIASTQEEYEALAIELATNPKKLNKIKQKLVKNRLTSPLFDTNIFTKNIEEAYRTMYERYMADLPPDHIIVNRAE